MSGLLQRIASAINAIVGVMRKRKAPHLSAHEEAEAGVRRLVQEHCPAAQYAVILLHVADGVPDLTIPVLLSGACGGPPPRPRFALVRESA